MQAHAPTVHIVLAAFNGANYLAEQLASIAAQSYQKWTLTVSDDGSTDRTLQIVEEWKSTVRQPVQVLAGPGIGSSTANFLSTLPRFNRLESNDLIAFCDQDDYWLSHKLERAVTWHRSHADQPYRLYCTTTQVVDEQLKPLFLSPCSGQQPAFGHALVQNIASGNTMVLSYGLVQMLCMVRLNHSVWHDWTAYLIAEAVGGVVYLDKTPSVLYRQHEANVVGMRMRGLGVLRNLRLLMSGRYRDWLTKNQCAINDILPNVVEGNLQIFRDFRSMRSEKRAWSRVRRFLRSGIRRYGLYSNTVLMLAVWMRRA